MSYVQVNSTQNGQAFITITCGIPLGTYAYYIIGPIPRSPPEGVMAAARPITFGGVPI